MKFKIKLEQLCVFTKNVTFKSLITFIMWIKFCEVAFYFKRDHHYFIYFNLKVVSATFLLVCLGTRALVILGKMFFISLQKAFSYLKKSHFSILDFQISWHHQMPNHKTTNTFYWITLEVNMVCWWNLASLCHILKEIFSSKNYTKNVTWKLVPGPFVLAKN